MHNHHNLKAEAANSRVYLVRGFERLTTITFVWFQGLMEPLVNCLILFPLTREGIFSHEGTYVVGS